MVGGPASIQAEATRSIHATNYFFVAGGNAAGAAKSLSRRQQTDPLETALADLHDEFDVGGQHEIPAGDPLPVEAYGPLLDHPHSFGIAGNQLRPGAAGG